MARVKGAMMTRKRRNKILKMAKGYWGAKSKHFKMANEQVMKSLTYAYVGRKQKKRNFRQLWITRISAAWPAWRSTGRCWQRWPSTTRPPSPRSPSCPRQSWHKYSIHSRPGSPGPCFYQKVQPSRKEGCTFFVGSMWRPLCQRMLYRLNTWSSSSVEVASFSFPARSSTMVPWSSISRRSPYSTA